MLQVGIATSRARWRQGGKDLGRCSVKPVKPVKNHAMRHAIDLREIAIDHGEDAVHCRDHAIKSPVNMYLRVSQDYPVFQKKNLGHFPKKKSRKHMFVGVLIATGRQSTA